MSGIVWTLEGHNGDQWNLTESDRGVRVARDGMTGLISAPVKTLYDEHAFQRGATYRGKRFQPRQFVLGLDIYGKGDPWVPGLGDGTWQEVASDVQAALDFDKPAYLHAESETDYRTLQFRLAREIETHWKQDPGGINYGRMTITGMAGDPFYYARDQQRVWASETDTRGVDTGSPTGHRVETGTVTVSNPTNIPAYAYWEAQSPAADTTWILPDHSFGSDEYGRAVQDADRQIVMPPLMAGEHAWWATDPLHRDGPCGTVLNTPLYMRMRGVSFLYAIPPRTPATELPVAVSNAPAGTSVRCTIRHAYLNPFGDV